MSVTEVQVQPRTFYALSFLLSFLLRPTDPSLPHSSSFLCVCHAGQRRNPAYANWAQMAPRRVISSPGMTLHTEADLAEQMLTRIKQTKCTNTYYYHFRLANCSELSTYTPLKGMITQLGSVLSKRQKRDRRSRKVTEKERS